MEFNQEISQLQAVLRYAHQIYSSGTPSYDVIKDTTTSLRDSISSSDVTLQYRYVASLLVSSGYTGPGLQYFYSVERALPQISHAMLFDVLQSCDLYPIFFELLSCMPPTVVRCVVSDLVSHIRSLPRERQVTNVIILCRWLCFSQYSPIFSATVDPESSKHDRSSTRTSKVIGDKSPRKATDSTPIDDLKFALGKISANKSADDYNVILSSLITILQGVLTKKAGKTSRSGDDLDKSDPESLELLFATCSLLCLAYGPSPTLHSKTSAASQSTTFSKFSEQFKGNWDEKKLNKMFTLLNSQSASDVETRTSKYDLSAHVNALQAMLRAQLQVLKKSKGILKSVLIGIKTSKSSSGNIDGVEVNITFSLPPHFIQALLQQAKNLPSNVCSSDIKSELHMLWSEVDDLCDIGSEETISLDIYRVKERLPGYEMSLLNVIRKFDNESCSSCVQQNVDLLVSTDAITVLVQVLVDMSVRNLSIVQGRKLATIAFFKLSTDKQSSLLYHLYSCYDLSKVFSADAMYRARLTTTFNRLTEQDIDMCVSTIGMLALQSPFETLEKILNSAFSNKKQHVVILKILLALPGLCQLPDIHSDLNADNARQQGHLLTHMIRKFIEESKGNVRQEENILEFITLLVQDKSLLPMCLLSGEDLLNECILPIIMKSIGHNSASSDQKELADVATGISTRLPFCLRLILSAFNYQSEDIPASLVPSLLLVVGWMLHMCQTAGQSSSQMCTVKDLCADVISHYSIRLPEASLQWLWCQLSSLHWTVIHHFHMLSFEANLPIPWPASLDEILCKESLDNQLYLSCEDDGCGITSLIELCRISPDRWQHCIRIEAWSQPDSYPRLLAALVKILPTCSYREVENISEMLLLQITSGYLAVSVSKLFLDLPSDDQLKAISAELQLTQVIQDVVWAISSSCSEHQRSNILCHVTKAFSKVYQSQVMDKFFDEPSSDRESKINSQRKVLSYHSAEYLLVHCYVQISHQVHVVSASDHLAVLMLEIAKHYVQLQETASKQVQDMQRVRDMVICLAQGSHKLSSNHRTALIKTLLTCIDADQLGLLVNK